MYDEWEFWKGVNLPRTAADLFGNSQSFQCNGLYAGLYSSIDNKGTNNNYTDFGQEQ